MSSVLEYNETGTSIENYDNGSDSGWQPWNNSKTTSWDIQDECGDSLWNKVRSGNTFQENLVNKSGGNGSDTSSWKIIITKMEKALQN